MTAKHDLFLEVQNEEEVADVARNQDHYRDFYQHRTSLIPYCMGPRDPRVYRPDHYLIFRRGVPDETVITFRLALLSLSTIMGKF